MECWSVGGVGVLGLSRVLQSQSEYSSCFPQQGKDMEKSAKMNLATVVAYGEALWDLLPSGPVLGGAPLNFAYRINSLGYRGVIISQLGSDSFGNQALEQMTALGMDTAFIQRTSEYPTGTVEVILDENKNPDYNIVHRT